MQTPNDRKIPDDEIDLRSIGSKISALIALPFTLLFSNIRIAILFVLAAVLAAVAVKFTNPKTYRSSFIIQPLGAKDKLHLKVLADLPVMLSNANLDLLASELKMTPQAVKTIKSIAITNSSFGKKMPDSLNCTEIIITTTDYNQFLPAQKGILAYLENSPYFSKLKKLQEDQLEVTLDRIEKDIAQLDSLKSSQLKSYGNQALHSQNNIMLNELIEPVAAYTVAFERTRQKTDIMAQKVLLDRFQLIKNCVVTKQPNWPPRILVLCIYFIPLSLLLCIIFLLIRNTVKKAWQK